MLLLNERRRTRAGAFHSANRGILIAVLVCTLIEVFRAGPLWPFALIFGIPLAVFVAIVVNRLARKLIDQNRLSMGRAVLAGGIVYGGASVLAAITGELSSSTIVMNSESGPLVVDGQTTRTGYIEFFVFRPFVQGVIGGISGLAGWVAAFGTITRVDIISD